MQTRTPLTLITGFLGSGKTTLLQHILDTFPHKIAVLMNEFGELSIDSKILKGKNVEIAELQGGCVCCSLIGEFEAAVEEIISEVNPEYIVVETTGIAEPDALISDIEENLQNVRLDGVITIVDADLMLRYPQMGYTGKQQIEDADVLILNKTDLVSEKDLIPIEKRLSQLNAVSPIIRTKYGRCDLETLFGISRSQGYKITPTNHKHGFESVSFQTQKLLSHTSFEEVLAHISETLIRAKGFVNFEEGTFLFNFVNGRWEFEPCADEQTSLVFIGQQLDKEHILKLLKSCEH